MQSTLEKHCCVSRFCFMFPVIPRLSLRRFSLKCHKDVLFQKPYSRFLRSPTINMLYVRGIINNASEYPGFPAIKGGHPHGPCNCRIARSTATLRKDYGKAGRILP